MLFSQFNSLPESKSLCEFSSLQSPTTLALQGQDTVLGQTSPMDVSPVSIHMVTTCHSSFIKSLTHEVVTRGIIGQVLYQALRSDVYSRSRAPFPKEQLFCSLFIASFIGF